MGPGWAGIAEQAPDARLAWALARERVAGLVEGPVGVAGTWLAAGRVVGFEELEAVHAAVTDESWSERI